MANRSSREHWGVLDDDVHPQFPAILHPGQSRDGWKAKLTAVGVEIEKGSIVVFPKKVISQLNSSNKD